MDNDFTKYFKSAEIRTLKIWFFRQIVCNIFQVFLLRYCNWIIFFAFEIYGNSSIFILNVKLTWFDKASVWFHSYLEISFRTLLTLLYEIVLRPRIFTEMKLDCQDLLGYKRLPRIFFIHEAMSALSIFCWNVFLS